MTLIKRMSNGISIPINHLLLLVEKLQQAMVQLQLKLMLILYILKKMLIKMLMIMEIE